MLSIIVNFPGNNEPEFDPSTFSIGSRKRQRLASQASMRLQLFPLIDSLISGRIQATVYNIGSSKLDIEKLFRSSKILVLKLQPMTPQSASSKNSFRLISAAEEKGRDLMLFYGDNYTAKRGDVAVIYKTLIKNSSTIISHSRYLQQIVKSINPGSSFTIVPDPCLLKKQPFGPIGDQDVCRILWFGQGINLKYLLDSLEQLMKACKASNVFSLSILTRRSYFNSHVVPILTSLKSRLSHVHLPASWEIRLIPWNDKSQPFQLEQELAKAHISFIPSDPLSPWKAGASTNRIVDSIQSGCITVASKLESYRDFRPLSIQGDDFASLIDEGWSNRYDLWERFESLRNGILGQYSEKVIHEKWLQVIA